MTVLRSIRTVMATRGMAMDTAAKNRYIRDFPKFLSSPGKSPGTKAWSVMPKTQEIRMPVKKGGTAMQNWFRAVWSPSSLPLAERSPRGNDTTVMSRKLTRLRHSVTNVLETSRDCTGWWY